MWVDFWVRFKINDNDVVQKHFNSHFFVHLWMKTSNIWIFVYGILKKLVIKQHTISTKGSSILIFCHVFKNYWEFHNFESFWVNQMSKYEI